VNSDSTNIAAALGRIPSGCSILTAQSAGRATGMLVSWVQQASFDPPALTVCMKPDRPITTLIEASGRFVLNLIGEDPTALFKQFGKGFSLEENAFGGIDVNDTEFGPAIKIAIAHLGCKVLDRFSAGDHDIFLAEIKAASATDDARPYVHIRKSGFSY